jgi:hypothetical protein
VTHVTTVTVASSLVFDQMTVLTHASILNVDHVHSDLIHVIHVASQETLY